ncbi:uncharacterized protein LOC111253675 isoform X3 [Varroa destructor]|uniref:Uncharacterized protein n=1 Tax=Varroa destructor TaxID=109461 RepID=A0A7M7KUQ6_VARDE|nr:uncharacterized protein LOC111253675 isoform X3 [Varroa destructor]
MSRSGGISMDELISFKHLTLKSTASAQSDDENNSQPNTATTSQNTTPGAATPIGTPTQQRKGGTVMKLNIQDSTWQIDKKLRKRKSQAKRANSRNSNGSRHRDNISDGILEQGSTKSSKQVGFIRSVPRHLRNPDVRFRVVLAFLMASILSIVFLTHHLHRALEDSKHVKMGIKLDERDLYIHHNWRGMLLHGKLANSLSTALMAHTCKTAKPGFCKEWKFRARLEIYLDYRDNNVTCYNVQWKKMGHSDMEDTYNLRNAEWYGMGEVANLYWPSRDFHVDYIKFDTGKEPLGTIIKPYWLSSKGVGIMVHKKEKDEVLFSFNSTGDNQLLLYTTDNVLNYTICKGETAFDVHMSFFPQLAHSRRTLNPYIRAQQVSLMSLTTPKDAGGKRVTNGTSGLPVTQAAFGQATNDAAAEAKKAGTRLLEGNSTTTLFLAKAILAPQVERVDDFNQSMVLAFAEKFKSDEGFIQAHVIVLQHWWQHSSGDLDFDTNRFPKPIEMMKQLQKRDIKVMVEVDPYVCLNSSNFDRVSQNEVLIHDDNNVPMFTRWKGQLCSPIDLYSTNTAVAWFLDKLYALKKTYGVDGFVFQVMMIGLFGHNLINPGCVGGDLAIEAGTHEDTELYVRWWQFAVFMPVLQVCRVPSGNGAIAEFEVVKIIRKLVNLREKKILKAIGRSLEEEPNFPVVRPLWALDPRNDNCYKFPNQFAVGNDMIVAPIVEAGVNETEVYLPFGTWCEDQRVHRGENTVTVRAELDTVIYFFRCNKTANIVSTT